MPGAPQTRSRVAFGAAALLAMLTALGATGLSALGGVRDVTTTQGDLLVRSADAGVTRLPIGADASVLTSVNGAPVWAAAAGASLPTATAAGEMLVADGAGTSYTATAAAGVRSAIGVDPSLPLLAIDSALHHWRCDESSSPFADLGSGGVSMVYVAGTREYGRPGLYRRQAATRQSTTTGTHRMSATVATSAGSDLTIGVSVANLRGANTIPSANAPILALHDGLGSGSDSGLFVLAHSTGALYASAHLGAATADSSQIAVDWSRAHRVELTWVNSTRTATLYIDGESRATATPASGSMPSLTLAELGGISSAASYLLPASTLLTADVTIHASALSAATILSRADAVRRLGQ